MDLDLAVEISALEHVFGPFQTEVDDLATARELSLALSPYTGDDETVFVEMNITFRMGLRYPEEAPDVNLSDCKGLSDQRIALISRAIDEVAHEQAGEHMLMSMCMAAKEALSQHNYPEGMSTTLHPESVTFEKYACGDLDSIHAHSRHAHGMSLFSGQHCRMLSTEHSPR